MPLLKYNTGFINVLSITMLANAYLSKTITKANKQAYFESS